MDPAFRFSHPIEVRYADLDSQRHVNHTQYLTYMETARAQYLKHIGLWDGVDFDRLGVIVASASCSFIRPILYGTPVRVGVRTAKLGTKSLHMEYVLEDAQDEAVLATGTTVLVAFDYQQMTSMGIPRDWRDTIETFEAMTD
ncbi:MAG: thioesterase family protein [Anaerolineales bacterium]